MLPPTFCLGATFPLVGKIYTTSLSHTGRSIGFAYAVNSVGAVLGSFAPGFSDTVCGQRRRVESCHRHPALDVSLCRGSSVPRWPRTPILRWSLWRSSSASVPGFVFHYPHWDRKMLSKGRYHRVTRPETKEEAPEIQECPLVEHLSAKSAQFADEEGEELVFYGTGSAASRLS